MKNNKLTADSYYNTIAVGYEELHREEQLKKLAVVKKYITVNENDLLLDVGCGTGITSNFPCSVVGLDPAEKLLERFSAPLAKKSETVCAPAEKIPFPDNHFDIVISITAIQNFSDIEKGILEIYRVGKLKEHGGRFVLSFLKKTNETKKKKIMAAIKKLFEIEREIEEEKDLILFCRKK